MVSRCWGSVRALGAGTVWCWKGPFVHLFTDFCDGLFNVMWHFDLGNCHYVLLDLDS